MTSIKIVDRNTDRVIGTLNNRGRKIFKGDRHIQDIETRENTFQFTMPATIKEAAFFDDLVSVVIPKEDGGFAEFIAFKNRNFGKWKDVIAVASYVDIEKQRIIPAGTYTGNLRELLAVALEGTDHLIGEVEFVGDRTLELEDSVGAYTFLKRLMTLFDVELNATITYSGPRITARYINLYSNIGRNGKKEITRGKDLISIERLVNNEQIITAIQAEGPIREDGTRLTVFVSDDAAFQRWNLKGEHRVAIYRPDSENQDMTIERLTQLAEMELKKRIASIFDYVIEHADISTLFPHEKLWIGDRCRIKDTEFSPPLYAEARVKRVERSIVDKRKKRVKIGEVIIYSQDALKSLRAALEAVFNNKIEKLNKIKTATFLQPNKPDTSFSISGDTWYETDDDEKIVSIQIYSEEEADFIIAPLGHEVLSVANLSAISANLGTVYAGILNGVIINGGSISSGTTIDVGTDLRVGNNIYVGTYANRMTGKYLRFNDMVSIKGGGEDVGQNLTFNAGYLDFTIPSQVRLPDDGLDIANGYFTSSLVETRSCGFSASRGNISTVGSVMVHFRTKKSYTPSSVTLTQTAGNGDANINDLTSDGFLLIVSAPAGTSLGDSVGWRGTYTA